MADEAKYRVERNAALKEVEILKSVVSQLGVSDDQLTNVRTLFSSWEPEIKDSKVVNASFDKELVANVGKAIGKVADKEEKKEEGEKKADPKSSTESSSNPSLETIVAAVMAAMKVQSEAGSSESKGAKLDEGVKPKEGSAKPGALTREDISKMSPEEINNNWEAISKQLEKGELNAPAN